MKTKMIRVGKYNYKTKVQPTTKGYTNILIHTTGDLSPYTMKDENGTIMENYWQFSKVWKEVDEIDQPISRWQPHLTRWEHPAETHMKGKRLSSKYWNWREKGFSHDKWVRYPNGFSKHGLAVGSVIGSPFEYEIVDYITARKKIYFTKYKEIAIKTKQFKKLKNMLVDGENIQINEVDGPTYDSCYPYNKVVNGSIEITEDVIRELVNNPDQAFGHGYCLAAILLGFDVENM